MLEAGPTRFLASLTMVPQWFGVEPVDVASWTLRVEMGFYIVISLIFLAKCIRRDRIVWAMAAYWVVDILIRGAANGFPRGPHLGTGDFGYLFLAGMAYFLLWEGVTNPRWLLWALFLQAPFVELIRGNPVAAVADLVVLALIHLAVSGRLSFLEWSPFQFLGVISYSLYLIHNIGGSLTQRWLLEHHVERNLAIVLSIGLALVLATALHRLVELRLSTRIRGALTRAETPSPSRCRISETPPEATNVA